MSSIIKIGETVRGLTHVSPLVAMKRNNISSTDISRLYFPDAEKKFFNNLNINTDVGTEYDLSDFDSFGKDYYVDLNKNGKEDTGERFKMNVYFSTDGNKLKEAYELVKPNPHELIVFVEDNKNDWSKQVVRALVGDFVKKAYKDGFINSSFLGKFISENIDFDKKFMEQLFEKGYVEHEMSFGDHAINAFAKIMTDLGTIQKGIGWVIDQIGDIINYLQVPESIWDTQGDEFILKGDKLYNLLSVEEIDTQSLKMKWMEGLKKYGIPYLIPEFTVKTIDTIVNAIDGFIKNYNAFIKKRIINLKELYATTASLTLVREYIAFLSGVWNGLVDFVAMTFKFVGVIFELQYDFYEDFESSLETLDNIIENWKKFKAENIFEALEKVWEDVKKYFTTNTTGDYDFVRIAYACGFGLAFIGTFFIPYANIAKIAGLNKISYINKMVAGINEATLKLTQVGKQAAKSIGTVIKNMFQIFAKGTASITAFFKKLWKNIAEWFVKNKEMFKSIKDKIKKLKPKKFNFKTTKMRRLFLKEETGFGWCSPNAVRYLDEVERLKYEVFILDGKLYTAEGKLFDTVLSKTIFRNGKGKAIFVMDKKGRIFASTIHERGLFHHSSFLAGKAVASAGEIVVKKGIIKEVTRKSGHYHLKEISNIQFQKRLKIENIDTSKINFKKGF